MTPPKLSPRKERINPNVPDGTRIANKKDRRRYWANSDCSVIWLVILRGRALRMKLGNLKLLPNHFWAPLATCREATAYQSSGARRYKQAFLRLRAYLPRMRCLIFPEGPRFKKFLSPQSTRAPSPCKIEISELPGRFFGPPVLVFHLRSDRGQGLGSWRPMDAKKLACLLSRPT